ncbi:alpha/beta fold hydrolase [Streptomyces gilvosporeus]|uniref:AB hydrolase-1 domain-containing protein n=1 Tax=Streptomyces gilvosporeus TaxID=553510 RepID=A0A1V0TJS7_9ACTN|nr:alpha/beta fold hydrolase [Streptomyces gilvosporeus]ARF53196.1 hypothetical protein B1H19_02540 [Streptomyces gilvosporeus]
MTIRRNAISTPGSPATRERVHRLRMAGYDFACRVRAASQPSTRRPIALLGGATMDMHDWDLLEAHLPDDVTVITFDPPGFGSASELDDETIAGYEIQAAAVNLALEHLEVRQVDLLGYCYGAGLACLLLEHHVDRVARVVLTNASEKLTQETRKMLAQAVDMAGQGQILEVSLLACDHTLAPHNRETLREALAPAYQEAFRLPHTTVNFRRALNAHDAVMKCGRGSEVPLLLICGEHDTFTPARSGMGLAAGRRGARTVVLDSGHTPMVEASAAFAAQVMNHFTSP